MTVTRHPHGRSGGREGPGQGPRSRQQRCRRWGASRCIGQARAAPDDKPGARQGGQGRTVRPADRERRCRRRGRRTDVLPRRSLVATPEGDVPIEEIAAGCVVFGYDVETGQVMEREVVQVFRSSTRLWVEFVLDGETLVATPAHLVWVESQRDWIAAKSLEVGMELRLLSGEFRAVREVRVRVLEAPEATYNFEVREVHDYFVGHLAVLVHNECVGAPSGGAESGVIYRTGSQTDNALTDPSGVSFRDSVSSAADGQQVFRPGDKVYAVDTSKLPVGSVVRDGTPAGHVSVNATPDESRNATIPQGADNPLNDLPLKPLQDGSSYRLPKK
ncbi:MAG: polymorphic toxin-type HINT domain-containing protein [Planctomycetota bacterium]